MYWIVEIIWYIGFYAMLGCILKELVEIRIAMLEKVKK